MPSTFSREAGIAAKPEAGITWAASGIQVWNGNIPALAPAPRKIRKKDQKAIGFDAIAIRAFIDMTRGKREEEHQPQDHQEVARAADHQGLARHRLGLLPAAVDHQVQRDQEQLPANKQHQQAVGQDHRAGGGKREQQRKEVQIRARRPWQRRASKWRS